MHSDRDGTNSRSTHSYFCSNQSIQGSPGGCHSTQTQTPHTCTQSCFGRAHPPWAAATKARSQPSSKGHHPHIARVSFAPPRAHCARRRCRPRWVQSRSVARRDPWSWGRDHQEGCRCGGCLSARRCWRGEGQIFVERSRVEYVSYVTHYERFCCTILRTYSPTSQNQEYYTHRQSHHQRQCDVVTPIRDDRAWVYKAL